MCLQRLENPQSVKQSITGERLRKMRHALWEAKVAMYEAKHQSERLGHPLGDRIDNMFRSVENLFLEARSEETKRLAAIEDALTAEYGPPVNHAR